MKKTISDDEKSVAPREIPLAPDLVAYVEALSEKARGVISFRTGSGRILTDLLTHWPMVEHWEEKALELCQRITDAIYPLAGELFAQGVEITTTISPTPIEAPEHVDAMMTCVIFDSLKKIEKTYFLSPNLPMPIKAMLRSEKGLIVLCRPLHLHYHNVQDDREHNAHPHIGIFELAQRLINEIYEQPAFIAREKDIISTIKTKIDELPKTLESAEAAAQTTLPKHPSERQPVLVIPTISSLSSLPGTLQSLERLLLTYVIDPSVSAELRYKLRQIVQILLAVYPQALIAEAARYETSRRSVDSTKTRMVPNAFPKATPVTDVGKLSAVVRAKRAQKPVAAVTPILTD